MFPSSSNSVPSLLVDNIAAAKNDPVKRRSLMKSWLAASRSKGDPEPSPSYRKLATPDEIGLARIYLTATAALEEHQSATANFSESAAEGFRLIRDDAREGLLAFGLLD